MILEREEEKRIENFCAGKKYICLQFPDHLLECSASIVSRLELLCGEVDFFLMADTTFGSCCIDNVAGEHGNADGIIHFGAACLSKPSASCPEVLWIFERVPVETSDVFQAMQAIKKEECVLVLTDTFTYHCVEPLKKLVAQSSSLTVIFSTIRDYYNPNSSNSGEGPLIYIQGRSFSIPSSLGVNLTDITLFYIGGDSLSLSNIVMNINFSRVLNFDPSSSSVKELTGEASAIIRRRYIMVQKARDANTIGIVVGTLGVGMFFYFCTCDIAVYDELSSPIGRAVLFLERGCADLKRF